MCACGVCVACVCVCVLTSGHDEVAVQLSNDEGLGETPEVFLEQTGHIMRVDIPLQLHILTAVKAFTKLQEGGGEDRGGKGRGGERRGGEE